MKFIKKYENFEIDSKSKEIGEVKFPEFKGDKIYMLEFDLSNPKLPEKYKRWESVIQEMIEKSPVKKGKAYLTVDEENVIPGNSHRRGGVHIDGNFIYGFKDGKVVEINTHNESTSWSGPVSWGTTIDEDEDDEDEDDKEKEYKPNWSRPVSWSSNSRPADYSSSNSWSSTGTTSWATGLLVGGLNEEQHLRQYCSEKGGILIASNYEACDGWNGKFKNIPLGGGDCSHIDVSNLEKYRLKANKVYLGNSTFLHESVKINEPVKRQMVRITLPEEIIL